MPDHDRDPSAPTHSDHAGLTPRRWWALDDVLAEMCERTDGTLEDLHDRGRGILETCRPGSSEPPPDDETGLRRHITR
ncbi:hypothetical protein [Saccharomonospora iraqiensis]|uniref:hypothetical protein n=1 Tax=Saccharomonospora iraqiensis TaxID=52698 RepID=UPI000425734C|nr:hypothetical protein [Saccharomonospora iraqiensis]